MSEQDRLEKLKGDVHIPSGVMLKRIGTYLKPEWWRFTLASLFILVNVALDIVLPLIVSWITSDLKADGINLNYVKGLAVSYVAIGATKCSSISKNSRKVSLTRCPLARS